jgi:hypothetical protein
LVSANVLPLAEQLAESTKGTNAVAIKAVTNLTSHGKQIIRSCIKVLAVFYRSKGCFVANEGAKVRLTMSSKQPP